MSAQASSPKTKKRTASAPVSVEAWLAALEEHPFKPEIIALRQLILAVDPSIAEGIKWNVASFHTTAYFATFHLRAKEGVQVILHLGAKVRADASVAIEDPTALLTWLAKDRAVVQFRNLQDIEAKQVAFAQVIRQWIKFI